LQHLFCGTLYNQSKCKNILFHCLSISSSNFFEFLREKMAGKIGGKKLAGKNWRENVVVSATIETGKKR
jgi:hypothetical protein